MTVEQIIDKLKAINDFEQVYADIFVRYIQCVDSKIKSIFFSSITQGDINSGYLKPYNEIITDFANHYIFRTAALVSKNNLNSVIKSTDNLDTYLKKWYADNNDTVGRALVGESLKVYMPEAFSDPQSTAN